jgi:hypothetical protein
MVTHGQISCDLGRFAEFGCEAVAKANRIARGMEQGDLQ